MRAALMRIIKRVALYCRVSDAKQAEKELSIPSQIKALEKYAHDHGWEVVKIYVDEAQSGRTANRPVFQEMMAEARQPEPLFDAVLVWKLDRFARNREDSVLYKSFLRRKGIQIISLNEHIEDSAQGRFIEAVFEANAQLFSENLAQDVKRGMRQAASRGYFCGGSVLYGYKLIKVTEGQAVRSKLIPDEVTAPVVKRMARECLEGRGLKAIAKGLNADGIPGPRGGSWSITGVYAVLTNESLTGTLVWGRRSASQQSDITRVKHAWKPIVDRATFQNIQSVLAARGPKYIRPRSVPSDYLLGGLMRCACCGASMIGHAAKSHQYFYYRCGSAMRRGAEACPGRLIPKEKIEGFVLGKIRDYVLTEDNLEELKDMINQEIRELLGGQVKRGKILKKQLQDVEKRLDRLYSALETGKLNLDELSPRIKGLVSNKTEMESALHKDQAEVTERQMEIDDIGQVRGYLADFRKLLDMSPLQQKKELLRSFISSIEVGRDEVTLNYALPMPPGQGREEKVGVLAIIQSGRPCRNRTCDPLIKSHEIGFQIRKEVKKGFWKP